MSSTSSVGGGGGESGASFVPPAPLLDQMRSPRVAKRKSSGGATKLLSAASQSVTQESTDLVAAASAGSVHGVRDSLARGGDANYFHRPDDGKAALHVACEGGNTEIVEVLLDQGAIIDGQCVASKDTPLLLACHFGHLDVATLLLRRGAAVDVVNAYGNSPLHEAAKGGHLGLVSLLLDEGHADAAALNNKGSSPLHFFCYNDDAKKAPLALAKKLVEAGAPFDSKDNNGATPLLVCAASGRIDVFRYLVELGADIKERDSLDQDAFDISEFFGMAEISSFLRSEASVSTSSKSSKSAKK